MGGEDHTFPKGYLYKSQSNSTTGAQTLCNVTVQYVSYYAMRTTNLNHFMQGPHADY